MPKTKIVIHKKFSSRPAYCKVWIVGITFRHSPPSTDAFDAMLNHFDFVIKRDFLRYNPSPSAAGKDEEENSGENGTNSKVIKEKFLLRK